MGLAGFWRFSGILIVAGAAAFNLQAQGTNSPTATVTNTSPSSVPGPALYRTMSLQALMNQDVTSVAKEPQPYGQAPAAIDVITSDEIQRSGASSIPEALRLADNLDVAQKNSHDWAISSRGFNTELANKLLVLVDGRTVYTPLFAGVNWDQQDYLLEDIDRIEVISGPGGTLWGANAMNGVINIVSKDAKDTQGLYVQGGGGSELQDFGGVRYGGVLASNVYYRVYTKYFDRGDEVFTNGNDASDSWRRGQGGFRVDDEAVADNHYTVQGDFYLGDENVTSGGDAHSAGGNVLARWTHTFSDDSDMSLQMYYDRTHLSDPLPASTDPFVPVPGILVDDLDTYDLDFQHRFSLGGYNHFVWGLGYRFTRELDQNAPNLEFLPSTLDQNLYSFFVQDEIKLWEDLTFTLGTKVEHNDYTGFEEEPSGRLQWQATQKQMFWASVSRAVRMPSRVDEAEHLPTGIPAAPYYLTGNPDFASETLVAFELGYRAQLGEKVSGSLSAYYNLYDNIRSTGTTPLTLLPFVYQNNLKGETWGFELSADYQMLDWWRWHAGYNFLQENIYKKSALFDLNNGFNETADPENQVFLRSSMDLPYNTQLDLNGRWIDSLTINNYPTTAKVPGYFELDARLAWQATKWLEFSVVGQNLLHSRHLEYGVPGSATTEEIARSVYGQVTVRW